MNTDLIKTAISLYTERVKDESKCGIMSMVVCVRGWVGECGGAKVGNEPNAKSLSSIKLNP